MHIYNWYHSNIQPFFYIHKHRLQCTWRIPLAFRLPLLIPFVPLCSPFMAPFYLLETLLAVTGSVHLGLRFLVNWPPLTHPSPKPSPSKFPEPKSPSASLRRPQDPSGIFCPEQYKPTIWQKNLQRCSPRPKVNDWFYLWPTLVFCGHYV